MNGPTKEPAREDLTMIRRRKFTSRRERRRARLLSLISFVSLGGLLCGAIAADEAPTPSPGTPGNLALLSPIPDGAGEPPRTGALEEKLKKFTEPAPGVKLSLSYAAEEMGAVSGGIHTGARFEGLLKISGAVELGKALQIPALNDTKLGFSFLYPHGVGLSEKLVGDFNVLSNIDSVDSFRLDEAWLEQKLGSQFSLRIGLLAADTEFFQCVSGGYFLNSCFGVLPTISMNFNAPAFPLAAPGVRLEYKPLESLTLRAEVSSGDVGDPHGNNEHGIRFAFSPAGGIFAAMEGVYAPDGGDSISMTLGGFAHTGDFTAIKDGAARRVCELGIYAVLEKKVYQSAVLLPGDKGAPGIPKTDVRVFARASAAGPQAQSTVSGYLEGGVVCRGLLRGRTDDRVGIAGSWTKVSNEMSDDAGMPFRLHHEIVIEGFYQIQATPWLAFQPDIQYIIHPGATGNLRNALVVGVRATFTF